MESKSCRDVKYSFHGSTQSTKMFGNDLFTFLGKKCFSRLEAFFLFRSIWSASFVISLRKRKALMKFVSFNDFGNILLKFWVSTWSVFVVGWRNKHIPWSSLRPFHQGHSDKNTKLDLVAKFYLLMLNPCVLSLLCLKLLGLAYFYRKMSSGASLWGTLISYALLIR